MTSTDLYRYIRNKKPLMPGGISTVERLNQIRSQVTHHLVVGLLFDKAPDEVAEIERAFGVMQNKYHNMRFVLVEDPAILP
jgi:hypothetical protein